MLVSRDTSTAPGPEDIKLQQRHYSKATMDYMQGMEGKWRENPEKGAIPWRGKG